MGKSDVRVQYPHRKVKVGQERESRQGRKGERGVETQGEGGDMTRMREEKAGEGSLLVFLPLREVYLTKGTIFVC